MKIKQTFKASDPNLQGRIREAKSSAFKAVYSFYSGQDIPPDILTIIEGPQRNDHDNNFTPFLGLFGGFDVYSLLSNNRWIKPMCTVPGYLAIAEDRHKLFHLNLKNGRIGLVHGEIEDDRIPATPGVDDDVSLLHWFEEHANRLTKGFLSIGKIYGYDTLLRYPAVADTANCSRAVTRGVEIIASSIYVPEVGLHAYSIRIRLLTPDDGDEYMTAEERGFETCQLVSRHWRISSWDDPEHTGPPRVENVRGDGVIGMYPILFEGGYTPIKTGEDDELEEGENTEGWFSFKVVRKSLNLHVDSLRDFYISGLDLCLIREEICLMFELTPSP